MLGHRSYRTGLGRRFHTYTAELERGGELGPAEAQRFLYVIEGSVNLQADSQEQPSRRGVTPPAALNHIAFLRMRKAAWS